MTKQFRITTSEGSSDWMNCKDWGLDAMDALAGDCNMFYGKDWQLEYRDI
ncbi:MAG: hypothetical protein K6A63_02115 [Acholeplasmatales bacterium]|nr:hypothetical protein [Acholeplasmatales bacterium]